MAIRSVLYRADCLSFRNVVVPTDQIKGIDMVLAVYTGINGKTVGETTIWTASAQAVITGLDIIATAGTAITVPPTAGLGVAAGADDLIPPEFMGGASDWIKDAGDLYRFMPPIGLTRLVALGDAVKFGIDTGATGTTLTLVAVLKGYLTP